MTRSLRLLSPWLLLAASAWLVFFRSPERASVAVGDPAPDLVGETYDGQFVRLSASRGKVVVLSFWATWCAPCRHEAPILDAAHRQLGERGVVLGVTVDDGELHEITDEARRMGMSFPILRANEASLAAYAVHALPTTYILDREGIVVRSFVGPVEQEELASAIALGSAPRQ